MLALSETPDTLSVSKLSGLCLYQLAGDNQHDLTQAYRMCLSTKTACFLQEIFNLWNCRHIAEYFQNWIFFLVFVNHQWSASVILHILCKSNTLCKYIPRFCAIIDIQN